MIQINAQTDQQQWAISSQIKDMRSSLLRSGESSGHYMIQINAQLSGRAAPATRLQPVCYALLNTKKDVRVHSNQLESQATPHTMFPECPGHSSPICMPMPLEGLLNPYPGAQPYCTCTTPIPPSDIQVTIQDMDTSHTQPIFWQGHFAHSIYI